MVIRGRPASATPQNTIERVAGLCGICIPGSGESRDHRLEGLGALGGLAIGATLGAVYGLAKGIPVVGKSSAPAAGLGLACGAMVATNGPMAVLGVSDPRNWRKVEWASDIVPHVLYGIVTEYTHRVIMRS